MTGTAEGIQKLLDAHEIQQVLLKYPIAIDAREYDLLDPLFWPGAKVLLSGLPDLDAASYKEICRTNLSGFDATQHTVGPAAMEISGDTAHTRCYFIAQHSKNALRPNPHLIIGGWYDDEFERRGGVWRIAVRRGTAAWFDGNPEVLGYPVPPGGLDWNPGRNCPAWLKSGA